MPTIIVLQDDYAMYVTDDEAAKLAFETVQQLAELDEEQCFELPNGTENLIEGIEPIEQTENISGSTVKEAVNVLEDNFQETEGLHKAGTTNNEKNLKLFSVFDKSSAPIESKNKTIGSKSNKAKTITTQVCHIYMVHTRDISVPSRSTGCKYIKTNFSNIIGGSRRTYTNDY